MKKCFGPNLSKRIASPIRILKHFQHAKTHVGINVKSNLKILFEKNNLKSFYFFNMNGFFQLGICDRSIVIDFLACFNCKEKQKKNGKRENFLTSVTHNIFYKNHGS